MSLLTIDEATKYIEEQLDKAKEMFASVPVNFKYEVVSNYNDTDEGEELVTMFGTVAITAAEEQLNEIIFLSLDADVLYSSTKNAAVIDSDTLEDRREVFFERLLDIRDRLATAEDVGACIREINEEIDQKLQDEYNAMLEKLNASSKNNLKMALIATGVMLGIALICILINLIF